MVKTIQAKIIREYGHLKRKENESIIKQNEMIQL